MGETIRSKEPLKSATGNFAKKRENSVDTVNVSDIAWNMGAYEWNIFLL